MSEGAILVTGATGFLGGAVVRHLAREGAEVIATGRDQGKLEVLKARNVQTIACDLADGWRAQLPKLEAIVHCAALSSPWGRRADFERSNIAATTSVIDLAREAGVRRLVHVSTPSLYFRFADQDLVPEDAALPPPVNHYARTKRAAEKLVLQAVDLDPVILRPRAIYGRGDTALLPRLIDVARRRPLPMMRGGRAATDMTHVDDVVSAVMAAFRVAANPSQRIFNISGGEPLRLVDVITLACAKAGVVPRWRKYSFPAVYAFARAAETVAATRPGRPEPPITAYSAGVLAFRQTLDISRARTVLDWRPAVSFEDGVSRTFQD